MHIIDISSSVHPQIGSRDLEEGRGFISRGLSSAKFAFFYLQRTAFYFRENTSQCTPPPSPSPLPSSSSWWPPALGVPVSDRELVINGHKFTPCSFTVIHPCLLYLHHRHYLFHCHFCELRNNKSKMCVKNLTEVQYLPRPQ